MYDRDIHISASNLRDYWACNKRYQYRITSAKSSVATIYMTYGLIVHEGIERMEKFSKPLESILEWSLHEWEKANTVKVGFLGGDIPKPPRSFKNMYKSYVENMKPKFAEGNAIVEKMFKLPYDKSRRIYITGKMDRIDDFGVYDWKTGARPPSENDLNDIQFYLYRWAHEKLYDKFPDSVYYGHLASGKLYNIDIKPTLVTNFENLLDRTAEAVYNAWQDEEAREGVGFPRIPGYQCNSCVFKGICDRELYESDR